MNSETYVECLVKTKKKIGSKILMVILGFLTVVFVFFMSVFPVAILLAVASGVGAYFAWLHSSVEYEYLYLDRELSVDKIMSQSKRKRVADYSLDRMEIFAPIHSHRLDSYKNRDVKVVDYSIREELQPDLRYAMYYEGGLKVVLSPSEELVKTLKNTAPRKVFTD